jgi:hypothetical protein
MTATEKVKERETGGITEGYVDSNDDRAREKDEGTSGNRHIRTGKESSRSLNHC